MEIRDGDNLHIRHSHCGKTIKIDAPYDVTKFWKHVKACQGKGAAVGTSTLHTFFAKAHKSVLTPPASTKVIAPSELCPRITSKHDVHVEQYLARTGVSGGCGESKPHLTHLLYNKAYGDLSLKEQSLVQDHQQCGQKWKNDHERQCVFAASCHMYVSVKPGHNIEPCTACLEVSCSKGFKNALCVPLPAAENYIYLNREYQNTALGQLYTKSKGLSALVQAQVGVSLLFGSHCSLPCYPGCQEVAPRLLCYPGP